MGWTGFFRGLSAFVIAIGLLAGGGYALFQFVVYQFTAPPPRPTFPNDTNPTAKAPAAKATPVPKASPASSPSPSPSPSPSASPTANRARITLGEGLNIRSGPSADAERIDGVDYSDEVTILEESPDKQWLRVRVASSGAEGWIKSGYTEPITDTPPQ